jgi:hypothetical protein
MASKLNLSLLELIESLAEYSRTVIVGALVAGKPTILYKLPHLQNSYLSHELPQAANYEYCPCYWQTLKDVDQIENMKRLETNAQYCLDNHLNALPPSVLEWWQTNFLQPVVAEIQLKMNKLH